MKVMVIVKADEQTEAGVLPTQEELDEMTTYNEQLVKAGIMLAGEGLHPSSKGARVRFSGGETSVVDGPFTESKELVAGFWLLQVKSLQEAIEWVKRCPVEDTEIEIRQVFDSADFPQGDWSEREARLREQLAQK